MALGSGCLPTPSFEMSSGGWRGAGAHLPVKKNLLILKRYDYLGGCLGKDLAEQIEVTIFMVEL